MPSSSREQSSSSQEAEARQAEATSSRGPGGPAAASATAAALVSCFVTSILESPIELFRHRLQVRLPRHVANARVVTF